MPAMTCGKAETANRKVAAPCDSEIKVTVLVGRAPWLDDETAGKPTTALELKTGNRI